MECLTASFAASKPACEKQWIPRRVLCYENSSRCHKVSLVAYPMRPVAGKRSSWRSFAASLDLENGSTPSNSTSSSPGQKREQLTSNETLVGLAEEIANFDVPSGSRKINGKYIQYHLLSRLEAVHEKVMVQIKDVESLRPREIAVYWVGMAENVQIMGSFDGWSHGEAMSREYSGYYARFSATLRLRPGSYEIKFLVDGEWKLSSEYPVAGEGLTQNNKLVVE